ncbi:3,4-dihydroxy-2-butanone-4-phosphate synthase [Alkalihalobacillus sp. 1P02AB]|uniref:3,4-dihydroxy-2-butanone-4-phosphate synthase n=1 Tax=Alkalihalobacillus sp. 1P02AB TaxID=3132260 RepID=UPI0039A5CBFF
MRGAHVERVLKKLEKGHLVILVDQQGHGKLISLVNKVTAEDINFMVTNARGLVSVGIKPERAKELDIILQQNCNSDEFTPAFAVSVDVEGTTTGISSFERHETIKALIDDDRKPSDFKRPGHIFPVISHNEGIFGKQSHVEAGIELAIMNSSYPAIVMCDVLNKDGEIASSEELKAFSELYQLELLTIDELLKYCLDHKSIVENGDYSPFKSRMGELDSMLVTNRIDQKVDYVLTNRNLQSKKVTPVYIHKQCHCPLRLCDCQIDLEKSILKAKEFGGLCICLQDRSDHSLLNVRDYDGNTYFVLKILEKLGVKEFRLMNEFNLNSEMIGASCLQIFEKDPDYRIVREKVV